jgi:hypothetical protein
MLFLLSGILVPALVLNWLISFMFWFLQIPSSFLQSCFFNMACTLISEKWPGENTKPNSSESLKQAWLLFVVC